MRRATGLEIQRIEFRNAADFTAAFRAAADAGAGVVLLQDDPFVFPGRQRIAELGAQYRLPTIAGIPEISDAVLVVYGPNRADLFRRAAGFVDKILKGANPAELPIEQPAKFDLIVNMRVARALGIEIPRSLLVRADRLTE